MTNEEVKKIADEELDEIIKLLSNLKNKRISTHLISELCLIRANRLKILIDAILTK